MQGKETERKRIEIDMKLRRGKRREQEIGVEIRILTRVILKVQLVVKMRIELRMTLTVLTKQIGNSLKMKMQREPFLRLKQQKEKVTIKII